LQHVFLIIKKLGANTAAHNVRLPRIPFQKNFKKIRYTVFWGMKKTYWINLRLWSCALWVQRGHSFKINSLLSLKKN